MKRVRTVRRLLLPVAGAAVLLLPGCALFEKRPDPQVVRAKELHAAFRAQPGWRKKTYRDTALIGKAAANNTAVEIALREQRGLLLVDGAIAMDFAVATGRSSYPTPKGSYRILDKKKVYASNLYGRIVGSDGATIVEDADTRAHAVPEGATFVGSPMPYWMRMTATGLGMHVGYVPGHRPASHGCIRLKRETATELFGLLGVGAPVKVDSFAPALGGPVGTGSVVIGEVADKPTHRRPSAPPKPANNPATVSPDATPQPTPPPEVFFAPEGAPAPLATPTPEAAAAEQPVPAGLSEPVRSSPLGADGP